MHDSEAEDQAAAEAEPTDDQSTLAKLARAVQESLDRRDNGGPPSDDPA
jgi:hypothetical protein